MKRAANPTQEIGRQDWRLLLSYLPLLRPHLKNLFAVGLLMLFSTAVTLAIPIHAGRFVDSISSAGRFQASTGALAALGILLVAQLAGNFLYTYLSRRLGLQIVTRLRHRLFSHLLSLPSLYFTHNKAGDLSSRMTSDVGSIQFILTNGIVAFVRAILTFVGATVLMVRLNVNLTLVVVLLVPATVLMVSFFGRRLRLLSRKMYDELGELSSHVQEVAGAIRAIKVFGSQDHETSRFDHRLDSFRAAGLRRALLSAALDSAAQILLWICLITVVVYGFYLSGRGDATYGELVSFMLLAFRVAGPMGSLTSLYASAQGAVAAASRLDDVLQTPPERVSMDEINAYPTHSSVSTGLEFAAVHFNYAEPDDGSWTIRDLSFTIDEGEKIALVGPSGAGKTTLACLILRLFDPQQGTISLNGRPYQSYDLHDLRSRMAYVPQEAVLYDASIAENIRFGLTSASDEDVRRATARAQALEFVDRLPDGFTTRVGDRGVRLSGGERQRLALARAFLRNPEILVLDEPTSALDAANENAIRQALTELMSGRTTIMVAHRLSLVRDLDRIVVLDKGIIREQGPHKALMDQNGIYAHLYRLQHGT